MINVRRISDCVLLSCKFVEITDLRLCSEIDAKEVVERL